jgi:nucleotide-binding universal stress UspA family protein
LHPKTGLTAEDLTQLIHAAADKRIASGVSDVLGDKVTFLAKSMIGSPHEALLKAAVKDQAELLVLGNSGHGRGKSQVGTVAQRAVRRAPCHVLIVRGQQIRPFQHVLACIDFSDNSRKAARHAIRIAQQDDAYLEFLHVVPPMDSLKGTLEFMEPLFPKVTVAESAFDKEIKARLAQFVEPIIAQAGGVDQYRLRVQRAHPVRNGILAHIEDGGPDLVVVGATGKTGLRSVLLGTTAEAIIQHSECSVLIIRPGGFDYTDQ